MDMKHLKKMAIKQTVKQAKTEVLNLKREGQKINYKEFEQYVKDLYSYNLKNMIKKYNYSQN